MASGRDEDRLLAEIERLLAREDPGLDARMSALTRRLAGDPAAPAAGAVRREGPARDGERGTGCGSGRDGGKRRGRRDGRRDRRKVLALVAVVIAVVGLVLTALLTQPSGSGGGTAPVSPAGQPATRVPRA